MSNETQGIEIQAGFDIGGIFRAIGNFFKGLFTSDEAKKQEQAIVDFAKTALGKLSVDAVEYAAALLPTGSGEERRAAALEKLMEAATAAGKDLTSVAKSTLNWFIETALQYVLAKNLTLAAAAEPAVLDGEEDVIDE